MELQINAHWKKVLTLTIKILQEAQEFIVLNLFNSILKNCFFENIFLRKFKLRLLDKLPSEYYCVNLRLNKYIVA